MHKTAEIFYLMFCMYTFYPFDTLGIIDLYFCTARFLWFKTVCLSKDSICAISPVAYPSVYSSTTRYCCSVRLLNQERRSERSTWSISPPISSSKSGECIEWLSWKSVSTPLGGLSSLHRLALHRSFCKNVAHHWIPADMLSLLPWFAFSASLPSSFRVWLLSILFYIPSLPWHDYTSFYSSIWCELVFGQGHTEEPEPRYYIRRLPHLSTCKSNGINEEKQANIPLKECLPVFAITMSA